MTRDLFSCADEIVLRRLPKIFLAKKEPQFDQLRRALKGACEFIAKVVSKPDTTLRENFTYLLSRQGDDQGLGTASTAALHQAICTLEDPAAGDLPTTLAWWNVAICWLRCSKEHFRHVDRLLLASLSAPPSSEKEVADWLQSKRPIPTATEVGLPLRPVGGF